MLKQGDKVPLDITVKDIEGKEVSLKDYIGKYLIIYFYPKDDTPGCTVEACGFRDTNSMLKNLGAEIIGISKDSIKSHIKFTKKFDLNFTLLSDEDHKLQERFGVWAQKKFMGREFMGTLRTTFLVDPEGKILHVWEDVKSEGHNDEVLNELKSILIRTN